MNPTNSSTIDRTTPQQSGERHATSRKHLAIATLVTVALWFVPYSNFLLYPLRLFITFIHESGHALASVLIGGRVDSLQVFKNGEGLTYSRVPPALGWVMICSGYLGTALFGAITLHIGRIKAFRSPGRIALYVMAISVWTVTALWGFHPLTDVFTIGAGAVLGAGLFALAKYLPAKAADFATAFLAIQCSLNALGDIRILLYLTSNGDSHNHNDAMTMASMTGLPGTFWAATWALTALAMLFVSLKWYLRATKQGAEPQKALAQ